MLKIYHNPKCSKSRAAVALLEEEQKVFQIIEYLKTPPTFEELKEILKKLNISARQLLRKGEDAYKENNLKNEDLTEDQIIDFMLKFPKLIERPIIVSQTKAVIARPIENLTSMLEND
jgi:arsenate reductase